MSPPSLRHAAGRVPLLLSVLFSMFVASRSFAPAGPALAAPSAPKWTAEKVLRSLDFTPDEQAAVRRGDVTTHVVKELSDKELALTMAVLFPAPFERLLDSIRSDRLLEVDRQVLAHGPLTFGPDGSLAPEALAQVEFAPSEGQELQGFFSAGPGSKLNLSDAESRAFAGLRQSVPAAACDKEPRCAQAVTSALRNLLRDRAVAYHDHGLGGIQPYVRPGGPPTDPAADLRQAAEAARFLADEYPALYQA